MREQLSTESHHREGLRGFPQVWSSELTRRKRCTTCAEGLRRGWSRVNKGSGWVQKELGGQGQSIQGHMVHDQRLDSILEIVDVWEICEASMGVWKT